MAALRTATGLPWDLGELLEVLHVTLETLNCELLHVLTGLVSYGQWGQKKSSGEKTSVTFCHWRCVGQQELIEFHCQEFLVLFFYPFTLKITFNGRVFYLLC